MGGLIEYNLNQEPQNWSLKYPTCFSPALNIGAIIMFKYIC